MGFDKPALTFKALCAVSEIAEQSKAGPIPPSMSLRFVLAYLFAQSEGRHKWVYDQFWRCIQEPYDAASCLEQSGYMRHRDANAALCAMVQHCKMPMTPAFFQSLRDSHIKRQDLTKPS